MERRTLLQQALLAFSAVGVGELARGAGPSAACPAAGAQAGSGVVQVSAAQLRAALREAQPVDPSPDAMRVTVLAKDPRWAVLGLRRRAVGPAEVHRHFADVWFVLEGTATLVTGGRLVEPVEGKAGELTGRAIAAGCAAPVGPGDLVVIPAGVPHWVSAIAGTELSYLVAKVPVPG